MERPGDLKWTKTHEWARIEGEIVTVGLTDYAVEQLKDLVYIDFPAVEDDVTQSEGCMEVESVKAVADFFAPVSGTVIEINEAAADNPATVKDDIYGAGWLIKMSDPGEVANLMDLDAYNAHCETEEH